MKTEAIENHADIIDEDATAANIQQDYTSVDFDGVTYWVR